jgi:1-acyl-sn-glycerol-3-phosphate acyltransferase
MLRSVLTYGYVGISLVLLAPYMHWQKRRVGKVSLAESTRTAQSTGRKWARMIIKAAGTRLEVTGLEHVPTDRPVVYIANHQSDFDIVMFLAYVPAPAGFVAKIELLKVPLLRTWIALLGSVFLDRKDIRQGAKTILEGIANLKNGHSMILFPEGTRSKSEEMLPFKAGSFKLATKPQVPIVPVSISGSFKVMEGNNYIVTPADVYMRFHPAVETEGLGPEELAALPERVADIIKNGRMV